jgi:hypothetical protein
MSTTPNYNWPLIEPTDFVTDLPADFEVFADAVDADLSGLLGGTTGQVLLKDSNDDHDFSWGTPVAGGMTELATGSLASSTNIRIQSIPATYKDLKLYILNPLGSVTNFTPRLGVNNDTGSNYVTFRDGDYEGGTNLKTPTTQPFYNTDTSDTTGNGFVYVEFPNYASTSHYKQFIVHGSVMNDKTTATSFQMFRMINTWLNNAAINEINITAANNYTSGTYILYGVN